MITGVNLVTLILTVHATIIDVKNVFLRFFILATFFTFLTFFLFCSTFFYFFKKRALKITSEVLF